LANQDGAIAAVELAPADAGRLVSRLLAERLTDELIGEIGSSRSSPTTAAVPLSTLRQVRRRPP